MLHSEEYAEQLLLSAEYEWRSIARAIVVWVISLCGIRLFGTWFERDVQPRNETSAGQVCSRQGLGPAREPCIRREPTMGPGQRR